MFPFVLWGSFLSCRTRTRQVWGFWASGCPLQSLWGGLGFRARVCSDGLGNFVKGVPTADDINPALPIIRNIITIIPIV